MGRSELLARSAAVAMSRSKASSPTSAWYRWVHLRRRRLPPRRAGPVSPFGSATASAGDPAACQGGRDPCRYRGRHVRNRRALRDRGRRVHRPLGGCGPRSLVRRDAVHAVDGPGPGGPRGRHPPAGDRHGRRHGPSGRRRRRRPRGPVARRQRCRGGRPRRRGGGRGTSSVGCSVGSRSSHSWAGWCARTPSCTRGTSHRATGQDERLDPGAVAKAFAFLTPMDEVIRRPGGFAPKIAPSPDADDRTRVLELLRPRRLGPGRRHGLWRGSSD